ncbi:MAG: tetratricopeptide repeat protein, partial [Paraprevotella sp.]|nr:tetratricopeptide repeat protein [Paraprevotella sp.]
KNHLSCGRTEQAVADFDKAVSLKPEHAKAHELFGDALSRSGKEEAAAIHWAIAESLREKRNSS